MEKSIKRINGVIHSNPNAMTSYEISGNNRQQALKLLEKMKTKELLKNENMNLKNEFSPIRIWAEKKGIYEKGDIKTQYIKFQEEAGELAKAIINNDNEEIIDAIGDCIVVLTSIAYFNNTSIEECINSAYNVISKRSGKMINGSFVKNK